MGDIRYRESEIHRLPSLMAKWKDFMNSKLKSVFTLPSASIAFLHLNTHDFDMPNLGIVEDDLAFNIC